MMTAPPLVLSGGGARGFAHLGVVKALQEQGIRPGAISGTSAGAIFGAFLADGFAPDEVLDVFSRKFTWNLLAWNAFRMGLVSMKNIRDFLLNNLRHTRFEELSMPFYVSATQFIQGSAQVFHQGDLIEPLLASSAIPGLFPPVFIAGLPFVDGGLACNLPVSPFQDRIHETLCVYVNPVPDFQEDLSVLQALDRAWHLGFRPGVQGAARGCARYIEPPELSRFGMFELSRHTEIMEVGYQFTRSILQEGKPDLQG